ncbi:uncharacterized protein LOC141616998 [Silene latifolia]|uniref:uncharacterized protein LOC141616998 n=1 Tax=Silene latifolia TaxID=37657 RepID=UPI003D785E75
MDTMDILEKRVEWMQCNNRTDELYINGVKEFPDFAFFNASSNNNTNDEDEEITVPCPCYTCNNKRHKKRDDIFEDLMVNGIVRGYIRWVYHGESKPSLKRPRTELGGNNDDIISMIRESYDPIKVVDALDKECEYTNDDCREEEPHKKHVNEAIIDKLINDAQIPLYPGCEELSKLSFILKLFQIKCMDGMTNKAFSSILKMFKNTLPKGADVSSSYCEARKMITDLGFNYIKIEACENDCMLFWKEHVNLEKCSICEKKRDRSSPKVLRYFPIIPRLQRLFMSSKTSVDMRWHLERRKDDRVLRHPADSEAWKHFDKLYPSFAEESRNVRLGLASDGFNPFGGLRSDYSIWPVVIVVYNLPPWMCMKQPYSILSLLIPGKSAPGNNIDVYLAPLIEELQQL